MVMGAARYEVSRDAIKTPTGITFTTSVTDSRTEVHP